MKRLLLPTAVILGLGSLVACGEKTVYITQAPPSTDATPSKTPTTTERPTPTVPESPSPSQVRDEYLFDIYNSYDGPIYADDNLLVDLGVALCEQLQDGVSSDELTDFILLNTPSNVDLSLIATINAAAVINFCPDQQYKYGQ